MEITTKLSHDLKITLPQVNAVMQLLDEGATVPFIARYRKEVTGGLDDIVLREFAAQLLYLRELVERRESILASIREQDKLTPELEKAIMAAESKAVLEDLYLAYKPKRRTKAQIAREAGLQALADQLLTDPTQDPETLAQQFLNPEHKIDDAAAALEGARHILMEQFAEDPAINGELRDYIYQKAFITSVVYPEQKAAGAKFSDYFDYREAIKSIPSHRFLALLRGQREKILRVQLALEESEQSDAESIIARHVGWRDQARAADRWLHETLRKTWQIKLWLKLELEILSLVRESAEKEAIRVFSTNLKNLLMAAPAGTRVTMGVDPGIRTGIKVVVIDGTGKLLTYTTLFPHAPRNQWDETIEALAKLVKTLNVDLISIGNGTASRETDKLINDMKKRYPECKVTSIVVSEAGASVYSASELASKEFPELDVAYRGAVSIARRLQDPLAELIKIDPKAIGVGQYQHDVNQVKLAHSLQEVMEDCVNAVGVDVNTASVPLLRCVAGLNEGVAQQIVRYREENGRFMDRLSLKKVPRLGEKAFEQAAGFLRIQGGNQALDASAVHPEAYIVVEKLLSTAGKSIAEVMGNTVFLKQVNVKTLINDRFGEPTVIDILRELEKPGRDPRPEFKTANFQEGVETLADLKNGMILEGVVTNVANFGAFVDIGVHQDGLVHKSVMADRFVSDPALIVKVGDIVKVKVLEVDLARQRIQLSMRLAEASSPTQSANREPQRDPGRGPRAHKSEKMPGKRQEKPAANNNNKAAPANQLMRDMLLKALEGK